MSAKRRRYYMARLRHFAWSIENWLKGYRFGPVQRCRVCGHTTPCPLHRGGV